MWHKDCAQQLAVIIFSCLSISQGIHPNKTHAGRILIQKAYNAYSPHTNTRNNCLKNSNFCEMFCRMMKTRAPNLSWTTTISKIGGAPKLCASHIKEECCFLSSSHSQPLPKTTTNKFNEQINFPFTYPVSLWISLECAFQVLMPLIHQHTNTNLHTIYNNTCVILFQTLESGLNTANTKKNNGS